MTSVVLKHQSCTNLLGIMSCAVYDFRGLIPLASHRVLARADPYQMAIWS
jgi:hypothetical protein